MEKFRNTVEFEVTGDYALFSDPITRVGGEKFSYQIPTYEALKGIMGIRPIKYQNNGNDLSYYTYLKNCKYQVRAHFEFNQNRPELECDRNENKHHNIAKRMIERGGRRDIFLGTRECQGYVSPCIFGEGEGAYDGLEELNFGMMYHGITYADEAYSEETQGMMTVRFWNPVMRNGVIEFKKPQECIHRPVRKMEMKKFGETQNFTVIDENEVMV